MHLIISLDDTFFDIQTTVIKIKNAFFSMRFCYPLNLIYIVLVRHDNAGIWEKSNHIVTNDFVNDMFNQCPLKKQMYQPLTLSYVLCNITLFLFLLGHRF